MCRKYIEPEAISSIMANVQIVKWYFVTKIVLTTVRKKCSTDRKETLLELPQQFIQTEQFLVTEYFLTCSWRFLISNYKLEQL